jgi:hypothetical protein
METMTKTKEPKRYTDYFVRWGRREWFILPTLVFFYNPQQYFADDAFSPGWGLYFQWLKLTIGLQTQKNPYYGK